MSLQQGSRRAVWLGMSALGGAAALSGIGALAFAQTTQRRVALSGLKAGDFRVRISPPQVRLTRTPNGASGPWGEVHVGVANNNAYPVFIRSADRLAEMSVAVREPFIQIGSGSDMIRITSAGVAFGANARPIPWSSGLITRLCAALSSDMRKAAALLQLRAVIFTTFPHIIAELKANLDRRLRELMNSAAVNYGIGVISCTAQTITETITDTVERSVEVWKTAEQQYQECFARETSGAAGLACSLAPAGVARDLCAATACGLRGFVDVLVGVMTVVVEVSREVTKQIITCVSGGFRGLPNPFNPIAPALPGLGRAQPSNLPSPEDIRGAIDFLKEFAGSLSSAFGGFFRCLLDGQWSIASAGTPIQTSGGRLTIPYGVRVCITAACAQQFTASAIGGELVSSWTALITLLAALSPEVLAALPAGAVVVPEALAAVIAALPAGVAPAALIIALFALMVLVYGSIIVGQMSVAQALGAFSDGRVCIEHPTFALAMITALTIGLVPAHLAPPIVTG